MFSSTPIEMSAEKCDIPDPRHNGPMQADDGKASLIASLQQAEGRLGPWLAALWTWLEPRLPQLDSREEKSHVVRARTIGDGSVVDLPAELRSLSEAPDVLGAAARLVARLDRDLAGGVADLPPGPYPGVDGTPHLVFRRRSWPVDCLFDAEDHRRARPPTTDYAPAMAVLAPGLVVVPEEVAGMALRPLPAAADPTVAAALARARAAFAAAAADPARFRVVVAPLGANSLAGFVPTDRGTFVYGDPEAGHADIDRMATAVGDAVRAAGELAATILLMPELALPVALLPRLQEELGKADPAPALTVIGLRHREVVEADGEPIHDAAACLLSRHANEAVVLGDDGAELFRHRKFTTFRLTMGGDEAPLLEDIRLGNELVVWSTPAGTVAVVVCLDAFAERAERIRRSPASLVLVPSLSTTVHPHEAALVDATRLLDGTAFVCNRHPSTPEPDCWQEPSVRSFWTAGYLNKAMAFGVPDGSGRDGAPVVLVFDLDLTRRGP